MPIQTAGHQVQVMPSYTAMDPNRVTFDPSGFTNGAMSSIQLLNALAQQKAFQQAQAELAATREGRLGALNAQNLATIQLAPQKNLADIALAQNTVALAPGQRELGLAQDESQIADLGFQKDIRNVVQDTKRQQAKAANELVGPEAEAKLLKAQGEVESLPVTNKLTLEKARQDLASITEDKDLSDREKLARIRNLNASAASSEANAAFTDRNRPSSKNQNVIDEAQKQLGHIEMSIRRLEAQKVTDPNLNNEGMPVPIQQYQAATRDVKGNLITIPRKNFNLPLIGTPAHPAVLNPEAEKVGTQLNNLYKLREKYTNDLTAALAGEEAAAAAPAAPQIPEAAAAYLKNNPNLRGAFDAKYGKGASESVLGK